MQPWRAGGTLVKSDAAETVLESTAVDARTGEEKRERRALLPKFLPRRIASQSGRSGVMKSGFLHQ
jgi:hypothetical protein